MRESYFAHPDMSLWLHTEERMIESVVHCVRQDRVVREAFGVGLEAIRWRGVTSWLADHRAESKLSSEARQWAEEVWLPQAVAAGWRYWALVLPESVDAQSDPCRFVRVCDERGLEALIFTDLEEARGWLRRQAEQ